MDSSTAASAQKSFDLIDCAVFAGMLAISAIVGVYQAYKARKNTDAVREYLVGGQNMSIFPISMSLIASYISGITILGLPAEMYVYGTQFWCIVIADLFVSLTMALVYLPVFYGLGITSSYEYLKLRFNGAVRLMGCAIFLVKMMLYIPLVIYVPALAFNQVTGINLHAIALLVCAVCIFYTTLVRRNEAIRDYRRELENAFVSGWIESGRVDRRHSNDPDVRRSDHRRDTRHREGWRVRASLEEKPRHRPNRILRHGPGSDGATHLLDRGDRQLPQLVGQLFGESSDGATMPGDAEPQQSERVRDTLFRIRNDASIRASQTDITRFSPFRTIAIMAIGTMSIVSLSCYTGLVIFATFYDCDPITTKRIRKPDQLLPYFVMEMAESIPGLPGLFVAGVFSAALSTMSTGLNSMAGVIYEDMIKPWLRVPLSDVAASRTMKATVVLTGIACVTLVFLVEKLGGLIQAGKSLSGITAGPLLGIFTLGMFFPLANSTGALVGGLVSLNLVAWISLGTQAAIASGKIVFPVKPVSVDGCPDSLKEHAVNLTLVVETAIKEQPFFLYRMSYLWYTWVGFLTAIVVGLIVSWITGVNERKPGDEKLYTPVVRRFLRDASVVTAKREENLELESTSAV
ncbi:sodium-coupled monocarboxylate transporter 2 isoform X6 [Megachile rotundata]|uniref:sodium-coupled monocarboxylate transporter 2 isoform X6 n=1 Tax=Megachile rotundata TaxID=143995 RepID=UPI003FD67F4E